MGSRAARLAERQRSRLEAIALQLTRQDAHGLPGAIVAQALSAFSADVAALAVPNDREVEVLATAGIPPEVHARHRYLPHHHPGPLATALRERRAMFGTTANLLSPSARRPGSSAVMPLLRGAKPLGALGVAFADGRVLGGEERALLAGLANVCGNVLDHAYRAQLYDRTRRLRALMDALVRASSPDEAAVAVVEQGVGALRAAGGAIVVRGGDGDDLHLIASLGYAPDVVERFTTVRLEAEVPLAIAVREAREVFVESRHDAPRLYGGLLGSGSAPQGAMLALPLSVDSRTFGAVGFSFSGDRTFDYEDRAFAQELAEVCSQAVDRVQRGRLYTRTARLHALGSALLNASTRSGVAAAAVETVVARFGAVAAGFLLREADGGAEEIAAVAGRDPPLLRELGPGVPDPIVDALVTGKSVLLQSGDEIAAAYPDGGRVFGVDGDQAVVAVPFHTRGGCAGALGFAYAAPRTFSAEERMFFVAVRDLCLQALDRARLSEDLQESKEVLHRVLERLHEGVIAVDRNLRVVFANQDAQALVVPYALEAGAPLPDPWPQLSLPGFVRHLFDDEGADTQIVTELESGAIVELVAVPEEDSAVLILRDVTRRERQERAEREFVSNAAHELRTPLAGIAGAIEALRLGAADDPNERDRFLSGVEEATIRLTKLVNALLILAHAQTDPSSIKLERVAVAPMLGRITAALEVRPGVRIAVECPAGAAVIGEQTLVEAALRNLAQNAARQTEMGSITFTVRSAPGERIEIEVRDTGSGIPSHAKERVFERFYRADTRNGDGFGLGLPLVREMVRALGGDVRLESQLRVGTTVRVMLPEAR